MTNYEALEREHFGDPDKRTGIYASKCSHGIRWDAKCPKCELISAREIVNHWGDMVDEARKVIANAVTERLKELKKKGFTL